jgi:hypothetical protein
VTDDTPRALGRRPPTGAPALQAARFLDLAAVVPEHPAQANYLRPPDVGLYTNDRFGVCGPTSVANSVRLVTRTLTTARVEPTQDDVYKLYRASGNPHFDPATGADDNGVVMQDMLGVLLKQGIGGHKPVAFAKVDHTNLDQVRAAVAVFGFLLLGVDLRVAQQKQTDSGHWTYTAGSPEWGGHAIIQGGYGASTGIVGSWGEILDYDDAFATYQVEEAWVVIWPEHVGTAAFQLGVDTAALKADYRALTGRELDLSQFNWPPAPAPSPTPSPTPVDPPAPADGPVPVGPTPAPDPEPGAASFLGASAEVDARLVAAARKRGLSTAQYQEQHWRKYLHINSKGDPMSVHYVNPILYRLKTEPTVIVQAFQVVLALLVATGALDLSDQQTGAMLAVVTAFIAVINGIAVRPFKLPLVVGLVQTVFLLFPAFGADVDTNLQGAIISAVTVLGAIFLRQSVTPVAKDDPIQPGHDLAA